MNKKRIILDTNIYLSSYSARSPEESAKEILRAVLKETPLQPPNLAEAIAQRFADFGDFELPTVPREPFPGFLVPRLCLGTHF